METPPLPNVRKVHTEPDKSGERGKGEEEGYETKEEEQDWKKIHSGW